MAKHLNPLEKEFLIRQYRSNQRISIKDFCAVNVITGNSLKKWMKQYDEGGLEGRDVGVDVGVRHLLVADHCEQSTNGQLVVLDRDPFAGPVADIGLTQVDRTYVGGRLVHER